MTKRATAAAIAVLAAVIGVIVWWNSFEFHECRKVGHSLLYCIMK